MITYLMNLIYVLFYQIRCSRRGLTKSINKDTCNRSQTEFSVSTGRSYSTYRGFYRYKKMSQDSNDSIQAEFNYRKTLSLQSDYRVTA